MHVKRDEVSWPYVSLLGLFFYWLVEHQRREHAMMVKQMCATSSCPCRSYNPSFTKLPCAPARAYLCQHRHMNMEREVASRFPLRVSI